MKGKGEVLHIEGYDEKVILAKGFGGAAKRRFINDIVAAVKDGYDISDSHDIEDIPEDFNHNDSTPKFGSINRVILYKKTSKSLEKIIEEMPGDPIKVAINDKLVEDKPVKDKPVTDKPKSKSTRKPKKAKK